MKLKEMEHGLHYVAVTNGSTIAKGERLMREKVDDSMVSFDAGGWLQKDEWKLLRNDVEIDWDYYRRKRESLLRKIDFVDKLFADHRVER